MSACTSRVSIAVVVCALLSAGRVFAAGSADAGKVKFAACAACHGQHPTSAGKANHAPKIGGQYAEYMVASLQAFAAGQRKHGTAPTTALSVQDMRDLAAYASKSAAPPVPHAVKGDTAAGKSKAEACAGCHGAGGKGDDPDTPRLAGQSEAYLIASLTAFKSGARKDDTMTAIAKELSLQDLRNLAAYFAAQHAGLGGVKP